MAPPGGSARRLAASDVLLALGVAACYLLAAKLGFLFSFQAEQVSAVWPPTGLALAATLRLGRRALPGIWIGALLANATSAEPLGAAAGIALGNMLEALAGAELLRWAGFDGRLARTRDVAALLGVAAAVPVVSASIGIASLVLGGVQPAARLAVLWMVWWLGDALGALVIAPPLLAWTAGDGFPRRRGALPEAAALLGGAIVASAVFFFGSGPTARVSEYAFFPLLFWAALRFGPAVTVSLTAIAWAAASCATLAGFGPFAGAGPESGLVLLQLFMAVSATTGMVLGAVAAQRRRAEESAATNQDRLLLALAAARMGVWQWTIATGEVTWSEGLETLHGLPPGGFAGSIEAVRALIHPEDLERVDRELWAAARQGSPYETEFRLRAPGGAPRWIAVRGRVLQDASGRPSSMAGVGLDVTERRRLEEELRQQARLLAASDRRKNEFLAMLAHELRNPLAPIVHAVELLERPLGPSDTARWRQVIRRQVLHLTRIVDDLLDVARITRGAVRLEPRRVGLAGLVEGVAETFRPLAVARRQSLSVYLPPSPLWLDADPTRLAQVISNLLHNAMKFTPDGGRIELAAVAEAGEVVLRVRDDGEGMTPEVLAHAFDLFAQGGARLDRPQGGLGLGLTLVRQLVELHGGSVTAASAGPLQGSELTVRLPAAPEPAAAAGVEDLAPPAEETPRSEADEAALAGAVAAAPARSPAARRRVLVVDDNVDALESLALLLRIDGHEVCTAADGHAAVAAAERFAPEVVLLDLGLPGLDGYAAATALRRLPGGGDIFLAAVTGYGQPDDVARSHAAGIDLHLVKPVEPDRIRELLRQSLPPRETAAAAPGAALSLGPE